jgi:hypothetical protein
MKIDMNFNDNIAQIERVYSGSIGCMCGCLGRYSEKDFMKKRRIEFIKEAFAGGHVTRVYADPSYFGIETEGGHNVCLYYKK